MKNQKGFSLIELLIVVVIIGIIAAIAIPNLIAARRAANEGSAQSTLRTLHSAEVTWFSTNGNGSHTDNLVNLSDAKLVDTLVTSTAGKSGYVFAAVKADATPTAQATFAVQAKPTVITGVAQTGTRRFCMATEGLVYAYTDALGTDPAAVTNGEADCAATTAGSGGLVQ